MKRASPARWARGSPIKQTGGRCSPQDSVAVISSLDRTKNRQGCPNIARVADVVFAACRAWAGDDCDDSHNAVPVARLPVTTRRQPGVGTTAGSKPEYSESNPVVQMELNELWPS